MAAHEIQRPFLAYPVHFRGTIFEHRLISLVADFFKIPETVVDSEGRMHGWPYDGLVLMPSLGSPRAFGRLEFECATCSLPFIERGLPVFVIATKKDRDITRSALQDFVTNHKSELFEIRLLAEDERRRIAKGDQLLVSVD